MARILAAPPVLNGIGTCFAAAVAVALGATPAIPSAAAQDTTRVAADAALGALASDAAQLRALGIDLAALEQMDDAPLLRRAVRALALPGKLSVPTQQRLLRRVWSADPDIRRGSLIDSPAH